MKKKTKLSLGCDAIKNLFSKILSDHETRRLNVSFTQQEFYMSLNDRHKLCNPGIDCCSIFNHLFAPFVFATNKSTRTKCFEIVIKY